MRRPILVITGLLVLCSSAFATEPVAVKPPQQKVLATPSGRYVFGQISDFRRDQFLLDTQTGRLWQVVVDDKENKKLQPVLFIQILGDEAYIPDPHQEAEGHRNLVRRKTAEDLKKILEDEQSKKK